MVCQACGHPVETEVRFCSKCGAQVAGPQVSGPQVSGQQAGRPYGAPPMYGMPPVMVPRVQRNLQTLGVLWCVYGAFRLLFGMMGMFFLRGWWMGGYGYGWGMHHGFGGFGPMWPHGLLPFVTGITVIAAGLSLVVGISLLARKPWGRVLGIVVAILSLVKFPVGTALGIYTLWVLAPAESGLEYDAIADRS
jgi:hypothetical protein